MRGHLNTDVQAGLELGTLCSREQCLNRSATALHNDLALICTNAIILNSSQKLQKTWYNLCVKDDIKRAESMSIQGSFFRLTHINAKCSHSIFYNWKVNDDLITFNMKDRLSILSTNFTTYLSNKENDNLCPFGCNHTENMAHLLNTFGNFYSRRQNCVVERISELLKECHRRYKIYNEKLSETIFPLLREQLITITNLKPHIYAVDELSRECLIIEVTVYFDLYLDIAYEEKIRYSTKLFVMCFDSLGSVRKDNWKVLLKFTADKTYIKNVLKWCSTSNIIGSNYVWRHRVKKLFD